MAAKFNYDRLDANIVALLKALNKYPGLTTIGSCGGHEVITNPSQWEAGMWYVKFDIDPNSIGWRVLEHLAWAINNDYSKAGGIVRLYLTAPPPYLNSPGECLHFIIEGYEGEDPNRLAIFLEEVRSDLIIPTNQNTREIRPKKVI